MNLAGLEVQEGELRLIPGWDEEVSETLRATKAAGEDERPRLVDTTMLYAPRSGGVKRYLLSKKAWLEAERPGVAHSLVVPGPHHKAGDDSVGQLAKSADPVHYAAAVEALFARDIEALGAAARVKAVERFSWSRVFEGMCMTYADVSGQRAFVEPRGGWADH